MRKPAVFMFASLFLMVVVVYGCGDPEGDPQTASHQPERELALLKEFRPVVNQGHSDPVTAICWSSDGNFIASGSWDRTVKVWEADNGRINGRRT